MDAEQFNLAMSKRPATRAVCSSSIAAGSASKRAREACTSPPQCTIDNLPDELLARVFQELPFWDLFKVEEVSHRWRGVAMRHGWTKIEEIVVPNHLPSHVRRRLFNLSLLMLSPPKA